MAYDNNLTGVLFKNDRKEKETHPDYKGSCEVGGTEYWISGWIKDGKSGKFISFKFTEKDEQVGPAKTAPKKNEDAEDSPPW